MHLKIQKHLFWLWDCKQSGARAPEGGTSSQYAPSRNQQVGPREPSVKTLCSPFSAEFLEASAYPAVCGIKHEADDISWYILEKQQRSSNNYL